MHSHFSTIFRVQVVCEFSSDAQTNCRRTNSHTRTNKKVAVRIAHGAKCCVKIGCIKSRVCVCDYILMRLHHTVNYAMRRTFFAYTIRTQIFSAQCVFRVFRAFIRACVAYKCVPIPCAPSLTNMHVYSTGGFILALNTHSSER